LICSDCGTAVEVFDETIENWANQIAKANKFKLVDHQVELIGTCAKCA
jgi:Fur family ferric uptake transcriptional regulator